LVSAFAAVDDELDTLETFAALICFHQWFGLGFKYRLVVRDEQ